MKKIFYSFVIFSLILGKDLLASSPDDTLFESDAVVYDKNTGKFTTVGEVKIDYKDNKLTTSSMEFDTNTSEIKVENRVDITNSDAVMDTQNIIINTKDDTASLGEMNVKFVSFHPVFFLFQRVVQITHCYHHYKSKNFR